jgi:sugar/nucleoside kinase (ribokinase family)
VVHFPLGAVAVTREGCVRTQPSVAIPPREIVGTNGAGDAFAAGFLYGFHEGWSLDDMLRMAHASAACSLRSLSTTGTLEPWGVCLDHAARWGSRDDRLAC